MFNSKKIENLENKVNSLQEKVHALLNEQLSEVTYNQDSLRNMLDLVLKETIKNSETLAYILKNMEGKDKMQFSNIEDMVSETDRQLEEVSNDKNKGINLYSCFVSVKVPSSVMQYLLEKSKSGKKSPALRRVFNRNGKVVLCPISADVVEKINANYLATHNIQLPTSQVAISLERLTISISSRAYEIFNQIAKMVDLKVCDVASAFIYTSSTSRYNKIKEAFEIVTNAEQTTLYVNGVPNQVTLTNN